MITGTTGSGKSYFARSFSQTRYQSNQQNRGVIVYDPYKANWAADFVDTDFECFCRRVNASVNCLVVVDESGDIGRYNKQLESLATQCRHNGHDLVFVCQRIQQLSVTVRENCESLYMFRSSVNAGKILSESWICPELENAHTLQVGEYYAVVRMGVCQKMDPIRYE